MSNNREMNDEQQRCFDKLTVFQKQVIPYLLQGMGYVESYKKVYPNKNIKNDSMYAAVRRVLRNANVISYMNSMQNSIMSDAIMTREEALKRLTVFARADFGKMVDFKTVEIGDGDKKIKQSTWSIKDSSLQNPDHLATISQLSTTNNGLKMTLHSAVDAIKQLALMEGWNGPDKVDHTSSDGTMTPTASLDVSKLSTDTLKEIMTAYDVTDNNT